MPTNASQATAPTQLLLSTPLTKQSQVPSDSSNPDFYAAYEGPNNLALYTLFEEISKKHPRDLTGSTDATLIILAIDRNHLKAAAAKSHNFRTMLFSKFREALRILKEFQERSTTLTAGDISIIRIVWLSARLYQVLYCKLYRSRPRGVDYSLSSDYSIPNRYRRSPSEAQ